MQMQLSAMNVQPSYAGSLREISVLSAPRSAGVVKRVMVIDDQPVITVALRSMLERASMFKVVADAQDGRVGLQKYREHRPDMLILDLELPGIDGIELIRRVRHFDVATPILVFSAQNKVLAGARAREAGAHGFIEKASNEDEILHVVRAAFAGRRIFPEGDRVVPRDAMEGNVLDALSPRQLSILRHLAKGQSNKEIAEAFSLSSKTVSTHKMHILSKLGLKNVVDLAEFARSHHLVG